MITFRFLNLNIVLVIKHSVKIIIKLTSIALNNILMRGGIDLNRKKTLEDDNNMSLKVQLYIMSLWLLFLLIFMLTVDVPGVRI